MIAHIVLTAFRKSTSVRLEIYAMISIYHPPRWEMKFIIRVDDISLSHSLSLYVCVYIEDAIYW